MKLTKKELINIINDHKKYIDEAIEECNYQYASDLQTEFMVYTNILDDYDWDDEDSIPSIDRRTAIKLKEYIDSLSE